jgi:hypothetical protein
MRIPEESIEGNKEGAPPSQSVAADEDSDGNDGNYPQGPSNLPSGRPSAWLFLLLHLVLLPTRRSMEHRTA